MYSVKEAEEGMIFKKPTNGNKIQVKFLIKLNFIFSYNSIDNTVDSTSKNTRPMNYPVGKPLEVFNIIAFQLFIFVAHDNSSNLIYI